ncbi:MAG UNVERIFIED_CONTAM: sulfatase [Planctomycetaceae bacterium]|jgi:arylsulfatase A-like enzyme
MQRCGSLFFPAAVIWMVAAVNSTTPAGLIDKPNLVVICIDDLGYGDVGAFGATKQSTPNIDRMAREGLRLTSFYASPVCSASRAQLMTGCYQARVSVPGVYQISDSYGLNPAEFTIAERLRDQGYATACVGKWHLGDQPAFLPTRQGFDEYFGIPYSNDMQHRPASGGPAAVPLLLNETVQELVTEDRQSSLIERFTNQAVNFITANKTQPFFLYFPHSAVHTPIQVGAEFVGQSGNGRFGDVVEEVDWSVGQILYALRQHQLDAKTLVIFTSDNGPWLAKGTDAGNAAPLRGGKTTTWEGGVRVPAIAWWPGTIAAGRISDAVVGNIDLLPTAISLAGGTVPESPVIDGRDMSPLLLGTSAASPRNAQFYFSALELQAVRQGPWKLALTPQPNDFGNGVAADAVVNPRLYNLDFDIGETTNVAADYPEVVATLQTLASNMNAEIGGANPVARRPAGYVENPVPLFPLAVLPTPVLTGPPASNLEVRPIITWNAIPEVESYDVWISTKTNSTAIMRHRVTGLAFTPTADLPLGEYRVWIQGRYVDGVLTKWSATRQFAVAPRPLMIAPRGAITTSNPKIIWTPVPGANRYDVWVNNLSTGQSPFVRNLNVVGTQSEITTPLPLGIYRVWVQPINSQAFRGNWSLFSQFTVTTAPTQIAPLNITTNGMTKFSWSAVPAQAQYDLWVRNLTTGQDQVIREQNLKTTSFTATTGLAPANYVWWIKAINNSGLHSTWSAAGKFTVAP